MAMSVSILGSTGVIGSLALDVLSSLDEEYRVVSLAAGKNALKLAEQIRAVRPRYVSVQDEATYLELLELLPSGDVPEIGIGDEGLIASATIPSDFVLSAIVGAKGLLPTWAAIRRGARIGLANKETLVAAGDLVMPYATECGSEIIPVDSEHSALFQSALAGRMNEIDTLWITASGGPFRTWSKEQMANIRLEEALQHPNWSMGRKITIDSASMMNKGLEVIEAHHLFKMPYDRIKVLVHPQSIVHSLVEFVDGSVISQMGTPDMRLPIQYALTYPERVISKRQRLNLIERAELSFEAPDFEKFPSLRLAYEAGRVGGYAPCVLNAANEVAVQAFMDRRIAFLEMARLVEDVVSLCAKGKPTAIEDIIEMDAQARRTALDLVEKGGWDGCR